MPQCPHCNKNYGVSSFLIKCDTCSCTWCKDGNCPGAMKKNNFLEIMDLDVEYVIKEK